MTTEKNIIEDLEKEEKELLLKLEENRKKKDVAANKGILDFVTSIEKQGFTVFNFTNKLIELDKFTDEELEILKNTLIKKTKKVSHIEYDALDSDGQKYKFVWYFGKSEEGRGVRKDFVNELKVMKTKNFTFIISKLTNEGKKWINTEIGKKFLKETYADYDEKLIK